MNERLSKEKLDHLVNKIIICRQIVNIPVKERDLEEKTTLKSTLKELALEYQNLYETMNNSVLSKLSEILLSEDYNFISKYRKYIEDGDFTPPSIPKNCGDVELKSALEDLYAGKVAILGILADLNFLLTEVETLKERSESISKGIMFTEENQWGAESVFYLLFPEVLWEKYADLVALKTTYQVKFEQYKIAFEIASRLVTIELEMPSDTPRRRKYEPEETDSPPSQDTGRKSMRNSTAEVKKSTYQRPVNSLSSKLKRK